MLSASKHPASPMDKAGLLCPDMTPHEQVRSAFNLQPWEDPDPLPQATSSEGGSDSLGLLTGS